MFILLDFCLQFQLIYEHNLRHVKRTFQSPIQVEYITQSFSLLQFLSVYLEVVVLSLLLKLTHNIINKRSK